MNAANPYESPSAKSESRSWRRIDFFAVGLWVTIPIAILAGRQLLLPVFTEFGVKLPTATQYLLSFSSPILFTIASLVVLLAISTFPPRQHATPIHVACMHFEDARCCGMFAVDSWSFVALVAGSELTSRSIMLG